MFLLRSSDFTKPTALSYNFSINSFKLVILSAEVKNVIKNQSFSYVDFNDESYSYCKTRCDKAILGRQPFFFLTVRYTQFTNTFKNCKDYIIWGYMNFE